MPYDESQHLHVGYYEHGHDLEAVALKVKGRDLWHVFFPFEDYGLQVPASYRDAPREAGLGLLIFSSGEPKVMLKSKPWLASLRY
jgi:hypothetical protein